LRQNSIHKEAPYITAKTACPNGNNNKITFVFSLIGTGMGSTQKTTKHFFE